MSGPAAHSEIGPSSIRRAIHCPGSVQVSKGIPEAPSQYAEEGSVAHAIAELKLRKRFEAGFGPKKFEAEMEPLRAHLLYSPEMQTTTDEYLDYVEQRVLAYPSTPHIVIEQQLDLSEYIPDGIGTADCILIGSGEMDVIDYKHGKGVPVSAEENEQMKCYALGAVKRYEGFYSIEKVHMSIVQPRLGEPQCFETTREALITWGEETLRPAATEAHEGGDRFDGGDWCKFCRAKGNCRHRADGFTALEAFGYQDPNLLTNEEIGDILLRAQKLKEWVTDLEEYSLNAVLRGEDVPGWKAVAGRSNRAWDDADAALKDLIAAGVDEALLYERKALTLASIEKIIGKKKFNDIAGSHIVTPQGKPTLVPESDKRDAFSTAAEVFADS